MLCRPSFRMAYDEMVSRGWQEAAADAWDAWTNGNVYEPPAGMQRFTLALITAANWDARNAKHQESLLFIDKRGDLTAKTI